MRLISRRTLASTSRLGLQPTSAVSPRLNSTLSASRHSDPFPFFTPPFLPPAPWRGQYNSPDRKGKGKATGGGGEEDPKKSSGGSPGMEQEVDDREWEMRAARAMLHLRDTLPRLFHTSQTISTMFPPEIFSSNVVLKLPAPFPITISGLTAYSMAFALAKNGMQAFHTDLHCSLERMTFSATPSQIAASDPALALRLSKKAIPAHRQKQIRVQLGIHGIPRLPPHHEATWQTSSLYTVSPISGLIVSHEVESIRPLPGIGVAEWLRARLLGWGAKEEERVPCPRAVAVPREQGVRGIRRAKGQDE